MAKNGASNDYKITATILNPFENIGSQQVEYNSYISNSSQNSLDAAAEKAKTGKTELNLLIIKAPNGSGSTDPEAGSLTYKSGSTAQITASPEPGWSLYEWVLDGSAAGRENPISIRMNNDHVLSATFKKDKNILSVYVIGSGVTDPFGTQTYVAGSKDQVTAIPNPGWVLDHWILDGVPDGGSPITVSMDRDHTLVAIFVERQYWLNVVSTGDGSGLVVLNPPVGPYRFGEVVTLTADPAELSSFTGWSGGISGSVNPATIVMDSNKTVTANFDPVTYTPVTASGGSSGGSVTPTLPVVNPIQYSVTVSVSGQGAVTKSPSQSSYASGSSVQLTATPTTGYSFTGWSGALTGSANPATLTVNGNKAVTAIFAQNKYTVVASVSGQGEVFRSPSQSTYAYGSTVQLTATPTTGYSFTGWSGALTGSANPATLTVNGNKAVTATFAIAQSNYVLTVQQPDGSGSTTPAAGSYTYNQGTTVQVTATSASGWQVDHWVIDGSVIKNGNSITMTMNSAHAIKVYFTLIQFTLALSVIGQGTVTASPSGGSYASGTIVTLAATPVSGYTFSGWSGDVSGSSSFITIFITGDKVVTATFTQLGETITKIRQIWKDGSTYHYAYGTNERQSTSFSTLWGYVHADLVAGDTIHFAGNTEYIANDAIRLTKSGITLRGDLGSDGRPTAYIRAYSSTIPSTSYMFYCSGDDTTIYGLGFSGLGTILEDGYYRDRVVDYTMVYFDNVDNVVIDSCAMVHTKQYCLNLLSCRNFWVKNSLFQYTQNGVSASNGGSTWCTGVIENNVMRDCSQAGIKLRLCDGVIVRNNEIHLEYTYWRSFNHLRIPGPDGRGVEESGDAHGAEGIYFGSNDAPSVNCDMYGNVITDASIHGTVGDYFNAPRSYGCLIAEDTAGYSVKTANNDFHDNTVDGVYYPLYVQGDINRGPQPLIVYGGGNTIIRYVGNVVQYAD